MKLHLIMPMGGAGTRFCKNGFMIPKPLIEIYKRPFFYWSVMSVMKYIDIADLIFVVLRCHVENNDIDRVIWSYFPNAKIEIIDEVLPGPVFTSLIGIRNICDNHPVLINDCDHMFKCEKLNSIFQKNEFYEDGALLTFQSDNSQFSYVQYDEMGHVIGTYEKRVVSNQAICGAYLFQSAELFKNIADVYIKNCPYNECFISGMYNIMCRNSYTIRSYCTDYHVEFGTPDEYESAKDSKYFLDLL